jgi:Methylase involved in ubiquinone/menaquinone biosynthesis
MALPFLSAVSALRAAGEPSRLRLLALLVRAELTVGELCEILDQSQPRVSRHLKVLASAGLLVRFREEHWVYYRVPASGEASAIVEQLLSLANAEDSVFVRDRQRMERVIAERARRATNEVGGANAALPEEIAAIVLREFADVPVGVLLDVGTGSGHLLELLAPHATRAVGIDISTDALRLARTNVHGAGLRHCELHKGSMYDLPFAEATFDTVTVDRMLATAERPLAALAEIARAVRSGGRLVVIEDFDQLQDSAGGNPIKTVREWMTANGFTCRRIHPIDTGSAHLIVALGERGDRAVAAA